MVAELRDTGKDVIHLASQTSIHYRLLNHSFWRETSSRSIHGIRMMLWYSLSSLCLDVYWSLDVVDTLTTPAVRMYLSLFECVSDGQLRHIISFQIEPTAIARHFPLTSIPTYCQ